MARQVKSYTLSAAEIDVISRRTGPDFRTASDVVGATINRYNEIMRTTVDGLLTGMQWTLVLGYLGGVNLREAWEVAALDRLLEAAIRQDLESQEPDLTEEEAELLTERIQQLSYVERACVVDVAEMYWAAVAKGEPAKGPAG